MRRCFNPKYLIEAENRGEKGMFEREALETFKDFIYAVTAVTNKVDGI